MQYWFVTNTELQKSKMLMLKFTVVAFCLASNTYAQERTQLLPVMKALLRVMETNKPVPSDINDLLILTRDLKNSVSNKFAGFANLDIIENVGVPKIGDVI